MPREEPRHRCRGLRRARPGRSVALTCFSEADIRPVAAGHPFYAIEHALLVPIRNFGLASGEGDYYLSNVTQESGDHG